MGIYKDQVALTDADGDMLSAVAPTMVDGFVTQPGCVSVTRGAKFTEGSPVSNSGRTQSVTVPAGLELTTLARLGDRLLGHDHDEAMVVTTASRLYVKLVAVGVNQRAALSLIAEMASANYVDRSDPFDADDFKHLAAELQ